MAGLAQTDDFNDGNDTGWLHYTPLASFGAAAKFTFPTGAYRIAAAGSPDAATFGPQRAGSLRPTPGYTRVRAAADLVAWNNDVNQSVGLIARVTNLGLGTTQGYTYNYNTRSGYHQLNLVLNEAPARQINESPYRINTGSHYRMVFTLAGNLILGQMFSATNSTVPIHSVFAIDDTHANGTAGVFAFALDAAGAIDGTFDNYAAEVPGKVRATLLDSAPAAGEVPSVPTENVLVRLVSLETAIKPESIRLEVDGTQVEFELLTDSDPVLILAYAPPAALDPAVTHTAKVNFSDDDGPQTFQWTFGAPPPTAPATLLSATAVDGVFATEPSAVLDTTAHTFTVPVSGAARFFRVSDASARTIRKVAVQGGSAVISFE